MVKKGVATVTVSASEPAKDGNQTVTVTLALEKDCCVFANPVGVEDLEHGQILLKFIAGGKPHQATVVYPPGKAVKDEIVGTYRIYEGTVTINATVIRPPAGVPLELELRCSGYRRRAVV